MVHTFVQEVGPFHSEGNCSLGGAIESAESGQAVDGCTVPPGISTIYLPQGTYTLTQADTSAPPLPGNAGRLGFDPGGFPVIYTKVTILGNGSTIQRTGTQKFPIFQATAGADLTLQDLTIQGGDSSEDQYASGGALDLFIGKATLNHVTLQDNLSGWDGGAVYIGQAPLATAVLNDSTIQDNLAVDNGGGIYDDGTLEVHDSIIKGNISQSVEGGGGIFVSEKGTASIDESQVNGNQAWIGGGIFTQGSLEISGGTVISGNVSTESKFTIPTGGGGIATRGDSARLTIQDSLIIGNRAPQSIGGGISVNLPDASPLVMTGSVVAGNVSLDGGGIEGGPGTVTGSCFLGNQSTGTSGGAAGDIDGNLKAGGNWWGSSGAPHVASGVATIPILTAPPSICSQEIPTPYPTEVATPVEQ
jgi:hypothetical protein